MIRGRILGVALSAGVGLCQYTDVEPQIPACVVQASGEIPTNQVASRWYQRARRGALYRRSTPSGRHNSQTLHPGQVA